MSAIKDGGPAFPTDGRIQHGTAYDGMSLRDWFAGQALSGLLGGVPGSHLSFKNIGSEAYAYADAMIAAREVKP